MILMPLQASSPFIKADWRRAVSDPPLPPITRDQILCGELATLLGDDYNLTTMVNSKLPDIYFNNYLPVHLLFLFFTQSVGLKVLWCLKHLTVLLIFSCSLLQPLNPV